MAWTEVSETLVSQLTASGCTFELPKPQWPLWAQQRPQFLRLFVYSLLPGEQLPSFVTTGEHVARLLTERYDPADAAPYNYNWYAVVKSADGSYWQCTPSRDVDFGHHLRIPVSEDSLKIQLSAAGGVNERQPPIA